MKENEETPAAPIVPTIEEIEEGLGEGRTRQTRAKGESRNERSGDRPATVTEFRVPNEVGDFERE